MTFSSESIHSFMQSFVSSLIHPDFQFIRSFIPSFLAHYFILSHSLSLFLYLPVPFPALSLFRSFTLFLHAPCPSLQDPLSLSLSSSLFLSSSLSFSHYTLSLCL